MLFTRYFKAFEISLVFISLICFTFLSLYLAKYSHVVCCPPSHEVAMGDWAHWVHTGVMVCRANRQSLAMAAGLVQFGDRPLPAGFSLLFSTDISLKKQNRTEETEKGWSSLHVPLTWRSMPNLESEDSIWSLAGLLPWVIYLVLHASVEPSRISFGFSGELREQTYMLSDWSNGEFGWLVSF